MGNYIIREAQIVNEGRINTTDMLVEDGRIAGMKIVFQRRGERNEQQQPVEHGESPR